MADCDPNALANAARCFLRCVPSDGYQPIRAYTLCQIAANGLSGGGGGDTTVPGTPTGFAWAQDLNNTRTTSTAQWNVPGAHVTGTQVWTSTDGGVTYSLSASVAAPGTSWTTPILSSPSYAKIRFMNGFIPGAFTTPISFSLADNWAARVVANGGAAPSAGTKTALETFGNALATNGLITKFYALNAIVPDSLIAALTPFICAVGNTIWVNNGPFVGGDLTVNGLKGDGATKYLITGVNVPDILALPGGLDPNTSFGMDFYDTLSSNSSTCEIGAESNTVDRGINLLCQFTGTTLWDCPYLAGTGRISFTTVRGQSFILGNRTASNSQQIFDYNSGGFVTRVNGTTNVAGSPLVQIPFYAWGSNRTLGLLYSDKRGSFVAIRQGLTVTQAQTYCGLVQALRTSLGGGFN